MQAVRCRSFRQSDGGDNMKLTFFGTGTSQGVPVIACGCKVCSSSDPKDRRLRSSVLVQSEKTSILVDCGPDFREQMIRSRTGHLDAILFTHNHKDHTGGLDDTRALEYTDDWHAQIYCEPRVLETLKCEYDYVFVKEKYPGVPDWDIHLIDENPFEIGDIKVVPIRGMHGRMPILGYRFSDIAYLTDFSSIPQSEYSKLQNLKYLIINTVCYHRHHSHFSLAEAIEASKKIGAQHTLLTHLSHNFPPHEEFCKELPDGISPAYDGLVIEA